ncbi:TPA: hypothetical protein ACGHYB_004612 [Shigella dysenteriae]|uniref:hypothetical protein n=1 Tax=Shigella TaxID=620 RepID=UPI001F11A151|nr:hypothetical protein [Shigella dysenteriae]
MTRQRVVGDLSMTQHTVALVFREGESPESREEKYWMTRRRLVCNYSLISSYQG